MAGKNFTPIGFHSARVFTEFFICPSTNFNIGESADPEVSRGSVRNKHDGRTNPYSSMKPG
jgi:hypothetical protein